MSWGGAEVYTYGLLQTGTPPGTLEVKLPGLVREHMGPDLAPYWSFPVQRLTDIHLRSHLLLEMEPNGSEGSLWILGGVTRVLGYATVPAPARGRGGPRRT